MVVRVLWTLRVEVYVVTVETYPVICKIINLIISIEEDSAKDVFILHLWNIVTLNKDDAVIYLFTQIFVIHRKIHQIACGRDDITLAIAQCEYNVSE